MLICYLGKKREKERRERKLLIKEAKKDRKIANFGHVREYGL